MGRPYGTIWVTGRPDRIRLMNLQPVDFKAVAAKGCFVYCYLRTNGSPYYIGISSNAERPFRLKKPKTKNIIRPIPDRPELVRVLRSGLSWEESQQWECFYIARYGRKDLGTGILRNRTAGGDGCKDHGPNALRLMREGGKRSSQINRELEFAASAKRYGVSVEFWSSLTREERQLVCRRNAAGVTGSDLFAFEKNLGLETARKGRIQASAAKYGVTVEYWESLSKEERDLVHSRYAQGVRGERLFMPNKVEGFEDISVTIVRAAQKYNVCPRELQSLGDKGRRAFRAWWKRNGGTIAQWRQRRPGPIPAAA